MKNLKRIGTLFLALTLTLGLSLTAFAAVEDTGFSDVDAGIWYASAVEYTAEGMRDVLRKDRKYGRV